MDDDAPMPDDRQEVSPERYEVVKAILGADAETFKRTKVGQYIYGRIANEEEQYIEELIAADPRDVEKGTDLRTEIYRRRTLPKFIEEAIQTGHAAVQNIDQMEASHLDV